MKKLFAVGISALLLFAVPTAAKDQPTCTKAYSARAKVIHRFGKRAPGRNVCRQGMRFKYVSKDGKRSHWFTRPASDKEKRAYYHALRRLLSPPPAGLVRTASPPGVPPAGTLTAGYGPSGLASCIIHNESRGDPTATNGQYGGIAQWSPEAWRRMGGLRYASTPQGATYQQQLLVLGQGLARYGCADWCPYDGC